jgi:predicted  nucleic acid-binding Zn-ribbon protein
MEYILGLGTGLVLGVGGTLAVAKLKNLFKNSEVKQLRDEVRHLKRRIDEKDRHVARMLSETEKLVQGLSRVRTSPPPQLQ